MTDSFCHRFHHSGFSPSFVQLSLVFKLLFFISYIFAMHLKLFSLLTFVATLCTLTSESISSPKYSDASRVLILHLCRRCYCLAVHSWHRSGCSIDGRQAWSRRRRAYIMAGCSRDAQRFIHPGWRYGHVTSGLAVYWYVARLIC